MVRQCANSKCRATASDGSHGIEKISLHKFPLHDKIRLPYWVKASRRNAGYRPKLHSMLCSKHFFDSDFKPRGFECVRRRALRDDAIPTKELYPDGNVPTDVLGYLGVNVAKPGPDPNNLFENHMETDTFTPCPPGAWSPSFAHNYCKRTSYSEKFAFNPANLVKAASRASCGKAAMMTTPSASRFEKTGTPIHVYSVQESLKSPWPDGVSFVHIDTWDETPDFIACDEVDSSPDQIPEMSSANDLQQNVISDSEEKPEEESGSDSSLESECGITTDDADMPTDEEEAGCDNASSERVLEVVYDDTVIVVKEGEVIEEDRSMDMAESLETLSVADFGDVEPDPEPRRSRPGPASRTLHLTTPSSRPGPASAKRAMLLGGARGRGRGRPRGSGARPGPASAKLAYAVPGKRPGPASRTLGVARPGPASSKLVMPEYSRPGPASSKLAMSEYSRPGPASSKMALPSSSLASVSSSGSGPVSGNRPGPKPRLHQIQSDRIDELIPLATSHKGPRKLRGRGRGSMSSMDEFNPNMSERERKKQAEKDKLKSIQKVPKKNNIYDANGLLIGSGLDLCDCMTDDCPGCHFPCVKCSSQKCGIDCRSNRKWQYETSELDGSSTLYKMNNHLVTPFERRVPL